MSFKNTRQTIFTGTELDFEEIVEIPEGYEKAELRDFEDGTLITGRPEMSSVTSYTFDDDGEEKTCAPLLREARRGVLRPPHRVGAALHEIGRAHV